MKESDFLAEIAKHGLAPPETVVADGRFHRFRSSEDKRGASGWYILSPDGGHGAFGCFRAGITVKVCGHWNISVEEIRRRVEARRKDDESKALRAAERARAILGEATPDPDHPYLARKGIMPHGVGVYRGNLAVPVYIATEISSVQFISPTGEKKFLSGGVVRGGCYALPGGRIEQSLLCEGFATGATLGEATGYAVWVCFSAGNIVEFAKRIKARLGTGRRFVVCADNDRATLKPVRNPGLTAARAAARILGARLVHPRFRTEPCGTDFNDLASVAGLAEVRRQVIGRGGQ